MNPFSNRVVVRGEPIVWGLASGCVFYYQDVLTRELERWRLSEGQVKEELQRLEKAMDKVQIDLAGLKSKVGYEIGAKHAEIFGVHQLILRDVELFKEIEKKLRHRLLNAEQIVQDVFRDWEKN
jgi:phosphoenolpyruvate-protein kinase (PTS system EI component)